MIRNKLAPAVLAVALVATTLSSALPVYAQDGNSGGGGFFSGFGRFFSRMFNKNSEQSNRNGDTAGNMPKMMPLPSGSFQPMPKPPFDMKEGSPSGDPMKMEDGRLLGLVKAGKITEAQRQAILAELKKLHEELLSWAKEQGIDPMYVTPLPIAPMGIGWENKMGTPSSMMKPGNAMMKLENGGGPDSNREYEGKRGPNGGFRPQQQPPR